MTVPELHLTSTQSLAGPHKFYPAKINVPHHQLRHFISTVEKNRIYYVNHYDIYVLSLDTQQRSLLATVPFEARCLAAGHGWVCVGGEQNGDSAFIKVEEPDGQPMCFGHDLVVDVLGGEIVNSMNIHLLTSTGDDDQEVEPVVLISNNDKTVKLYSLAQREVITTIEHPVPMNNASMSPDSTIIAAVGDSAEVYFYQRSEVKSEAKRKGGRAAAPEYDWHPLAVPTVPTGEAVFDDFSFAVAFSPSGRLCAASSQGGSVTVFDVEALRSRLRPPAESILCHFRSSRPSLWGCVRDMAFSPEPWDLLAWAEDHGRVGVADRRVAGFRRCHPAMYQNLDVKERLKHQHLQRMRSLRGIPPVGARVVHRDIPQSPEEAPRLQSRAASLSSNHGLELDSRERLVIEALETTEDNVEQNRSRTYGTASASPPHVRQAAATAAAPTESGRDYEIQLLNPAVRLTGPRIHEPRRRSSVILSESHSSNRLATAHSTRSRITASPSRLEEDTSTPPMSTNNLSPSTSSSSSQPLPYDIPNSDPWDVVESALASAREADNASSAGDGGPVTLSQIETALEAERRFGSQLERQLADERQLSNLLQRQLETQYRLLEEQNQELRSERDDAARLEPAVERILQRQLQSEQQFGEQRSQELETELRLGTWRARHLETEREAMLRATPSSAQTSALPTVNTGNVEPDNLAALIRRHEDFRRQRLAHIETLERQIRRAESRVALASSDIENLESAVQQGGSHEDEATTLFETRQQEAARREAAVSHFNSSRLPRDTERDRAVAARWRARRMEAVHYLSGRTSPSTTRATTAARPSELTGRATEADRRMAQMMLLSGTRAAMDANGNWVAGAALQRILGESRNRLGAPLAASTSPAGPDNTSAMDEMMREMGPGTAGLGWSPDGRYLFAGSEEGIFEFKVNMRDRMQFPSCELR